MRRISSPFTFFEKKVFPVFWFAFLAYLLIEGLLDGALGKRQWILIVPPLLMGTLGFLVMKYRVWDLADAVYDCGEALLIRKGGVEETIALSNIRDVSSFPDSRMPRITLRLVQPGRFGAEVAFAPPTRLTLNPFAKHPLADTLARRVAQARARSRA